MNIALPIITNLILVSFLLIGLFVGKNNGWKIQLTKLLILAGTGVGLYFLAPVLSNLLFKLSIFQKLIINIPELIPTLYPLINSLIIFTLFFLVYFVMCIIIKIVKSVMLRKKEGYTKSKKVKVKQTKDQKKLAKQLLKQKRKELKKQRKTVDKVFGALLGIVVAFVIGFVFIMPFKYILLNVSNTQTELSEVYKGYEYTVYGQLDKGTDIVNKINKV